jgi:hypothetical protein
MEDANTQYIILTDWGEEQCCKEGETGILLAVHCTSDTFDWWDIKS